MSIFSQSIFSNIQISNGIRIECGSKNQTNRSKPFTLRVLSIDPRGIAALAPARGREVYMRPHSSGRIIRLGRTWRSSRCMDRTNANHEKILAVLGLSRSMTNLRRSGFKTYVPSRYRGSDLEERDAVHRMSEIVLLHDTTGLRVSYLSTESYDGDSVDYKLLGIEIITMTRQTYKVIDVDFDNQVVITENERIPFKNLSRQPD